MKKQKQEEQERKRKVKQQQIRRIQTVKDHQERLQRIKLNKRQETRERQVQEQKESKEFQNSTLKNERRSKNQQRIGMNEILDVDSEIVSQTKKDVFVESSEILVKKISNSTTIRINFRIRDEGIWKSASAHTIKIFDCFDIEKMATNWVRRQWRLLNIELRMLTSQKCCDAVIADDTYTITPHTGIRTQHRPLAAAVCNEDWRRSKEATFSTRNSRKISRCYQVWLATDMGCVVPLTILLLYRCLRFPPMKHPVKSIRVKGVQ